MRIETKNNKVLVILVSIKKQKYEKKSSYSISGDSLVSKNREDDEVTCFAIDLQLFDVVGEYDGAAAAGDVEFEELQCKGFIL